MILGLALALAFLPDISGGAQSPRWAALSILIPILLLFCEAPRITKAHVLGALFLIACIASAFWSYSPLQAWDAVWKMVLMASAFLYASSLKTLKPVYLGFVIGMCLQAPIIMAQKWGYWPFLEVITPSGLFLNKNFMAEAGVIALIIAITQRWFYAVPFLLFPAFVPLSKGAILGFGGMGIVYLYARSKIAALALAAILIGAGITIYSLGYGISTLEHRLAIWGDTAQALTLTGHGLGSYRIEFPSHAVLTNILFQRPEQAHNDLLQMAYELGPFALFFISFAVYLLVTAGEPERLILTGILAMGAFSFPLYLPTTACLFALAGGFAARNGHSLRWFSPHGGVPLYRGLPPNLNQ